MIITIDGPAGSGKSTAARKLAAALEVPYLDTGAMYRAVALKALNENASFDDTEGLVDLARRTRIDLNCGPTYVRVVMDGHDVSEAIRTMRVSEHTSQVARIPGVRQVMIEKQRAIGRQLGALVTEGRDQGSVVFPDADVKFFFDAADTKRAERRYHELLADGEEQVTLADVLDNIRQRDNNDRRQWEALLTARDVIRVDTSHLTIHEVVDRMLAEIRTRRPSSS